MIGCFLAVGTLDAINDGRIKKPGTPGWVGTLLYQAGYGFYCGLMSFVAAVRRPPPPLFSAPCFAPL